MAQTQVQQGRLELVAVPGLQANVLESHLRRANRLCAEHAALQPSCEQRVHIMLT